VSSTGIDLHASEGTSVSYVAGSPKVVVYSNQVCFFVFFPYAGSIARIYHLFSVSVYIRNLFSISFHYLFFSHEKYSCFMFSTGWFWALCTIMYFDFCLKVNFADSVYLAIECAFGLKPSEHCGRTFETCWRQSDNLCHAVFWNEGNVLKLGKRSLESIWVPKEEVGEENVKMKSARSAKNFGLIFLIWVCSVPMVIERVIVLFTRCAHST
jgi:hypothetical protein